MKDRNVLGLVLTAIFAAIIFLMAYTPLGYIPLGVINATVIHIPVILGSLFCGPKKGGFLGFLFGLTSFLKNTLTPATLSAFVFSPVIAASTIGPSGVVKSAWICFGPRILVGVLPWFVYQGVRRLVVGNNTTPSLILNLVAAVFGGFGVRAFFGRMLSGQAVLCWILGIAACALIFAGLYFATRGKNPVTLAFVYAGITGAMVNTLLVMGSIFLLYKEPYAEATGVAGEAVLGVITGVISFNGVVEAVVAAILVAALGMVLRRIQPVYGQDEANAARLAD